MVERKGLAGAVAGLPGIRDYKAKEDRRAADKQLRDHIVQKLRPEERRLLEVQGKLAAQQKYPWVAQMDSARAKLQLFMDRVKTASYGYGSWFDQGQVKEAELDALIAFDQALDSQCARVTEAVSALERAIGVQEEGDKAIETALDTLNALFNELNDTFGRRSEALQRPSY